MCPEIIEVSLTVNSTSIRDKPNGIKLIHEILKCAVHDRKKFRLEKAFHDPEAVPVVLFPESTTWGGGGAKLSNDIHETNEM
jgi:hypothetical protein